MTGPTPSLRDQILYAIDALSGEVGALDAAGHPRAGLHRQRLAELQALIERWDPNDLGALEAMADRISLEDGQR